MTARATYSALGAAMTLAILAGFFFGWKVGLITAAVAPFPCVLVALWRGREVEVVEGAAVEAAEAADPVVGAFAEVGRAIEQAGEATAELAPVIAEVAPSYGTRYSLRDLLRPRRTTLALSALLLLAAGCASGKIVEVGKAACGAARAACEACDLAGLAETLPPAEAIALRGYLDEPADDGLRPRGRVGVEDPAEFLGVFDKYQATLVEPILRRKIDRRVAFACRSTPALLCHDAEAGATAAEVAKVRAVIARDLSFIPQRQPRLHQFTVYSDSTARQIVRILRRTPGGQKAELAAQPRGRR